MKVMKFFFKRAQSTYLKDDSTGRLKSLLPEGTYFSANMSFHLYNVHYNVGSLRPSYVYIHLKFSFFHS